MPVYRLSSAPRVPPSDISGSEYTIFVMSFLGGAECSTAGNPLAQFSKHVQDDKSLQRDRLVGGPGGIQEGMRSMGMAGPQDNVCVQAPMHNSIYLR